MRGTSKTPAPIVNTLVGDGGEAGDRHRPEAVAAKHGLDAVDPAAVQSEQQGATEPPPSQWPARPPRTDAAIVSPASSSAASGLRTASAISSGSGGSGKKTDSAAARIASAPGPHGLSAQFTSHRRKSPSTASAACDLTGRSASGGLPASQKAKRPLSRGLLRPMAGGSSSVSVGTAEPCLSPGRSELDRGSDSASGCSPGSRSSRPEAGGGQRVDGETPARDLERRAVLVALPAPAGRPAARASRRTPHEVC